MVKFSGGLRPPNPQIRNMSNYRFGDVTDPPLVFERIWPEGGGGQ